MASTDAIYSIPHPDLTLRRTRPHRTDSRGFAATRRKRVPMCLGFASDEDSQGSERGSAGMKSPAPRRLPIVAFARPSAAERTPACEVGEPSFSSDYYNGYKHRTRVQLPLDYIFRLLTRHVQNCRAVAVPLVDVVSNNGREQIGHTEDDQGQAAGQLPGTVVIEL